MYRVYGLDGGARVLLDTTTDLSSKVSNGFARYAVSGVEAGVESDAVPAGACVEVELLPPDVLLVPPCDKPPIAALPVKVARARP